MLTIPWNSFFELGMFCLIPSAILAKNEIFYLVLCIK